MTLMQRAHAALHWGGPPRRKQQQMACDLKLVNNLFGILQGWVCACPAEHWQKAASHTLDNLEHRPQHLLVHQLTFHAITCICESNFRIQNYFGRQKVLIPKRLAVQATATGVREEQNRQQRAAVFTRANASPRIKYM